MMERTGGTSQGTVSARPQTGMALSVVLPAYNEAANLHATVESALEVLRGLGGTVRGHHRRRRQPRRDRCARRRARARDTRGPHRAPPPQPGLRRCDPLRLHRRRRTLAVLHRRGRPVRPARAARAPAARGARRHRRRLSPAPARPVVPAPLRPDPPRPRGRASTSSPTAPSSTPSCSARRSAPAHAPSRWACTTSRAGWERRREATRA